MTREREFCDSLVSLRTTRRADGAVFTVKSLHVKKQVPDGLALNLLTEEEEHRFTGLCGGIKILTSYYHYSYPKNEEVLSCYCQYACKTR